MGGGHWEFLIFKSDGWMDLHAIKPHFRVLYLPPNCMDYGKGQAAGWKDLIQGLLL
jgi:hypothetical protein